MGWEFETVAGPFNPRLTEGPAWDGKALLFTHIPASRIYAMTPPPGSVPSSAKTLTTPMVWPSTRKAGCTAAAQGGGPLCALSPMARTTTIVDRLDGQPLNTPNDLAIDRQGRIWFSNPWNAGNIDPSEKEIPGRNAILRADPQPDGTWVCKRMTTDTTGTNGLLISPDWRTLYMIQTSPERRELRAYDIQADGSLGHYIVLHQFGEDYRGPQRGIDGMCLDAEGNIVATAGSYASGPGPMIYVWDTKGRVLETHPMPVGVDTPTNCTFGDPDQRTLYVTTGGGHLFRARNTGRRGWVIWPPIR